ncbi:hypothetical protein [Mucilaginibacter paludis]|uniref:Uncharacterized protein n=1 Tax=Mucilaginibacter paludis DSM 18603 TaxID=714943 RepID=H1YBI4_9SPHI|nr:hypothetical protein [Mucilaginibacter paludis]EHQ25055.1 hypothetical protein Mucpa_0874 [Mucilaginibacter paludis DSM 18603]
MKNTYYLKQSPLIFLALALIISSCTKIPGHYINGNTTTTGATFTYQLGSAASVTLTTPSHLISFAQANAGGPDVTVISAFNISTSDNIGLQFDATQPGTYTSSFGYFEVGALKLHVPPGGETIKVTTYNFADNGQQLKGTIKGSFSGFMADSLNNQVKFSGSFNITQ